ncbi:hypothetical protein [Haladaptatus sp. DFWS20]|uniref:hypothetical protein n=1 Tax=Haladaptatus sp. DFWS20 TaxID=3403467 RepID=UPI003EBF646C
MGWRIRWRAVLMGLGGAVATFGAGLIGLVGNVPRDEVVNQLWYPLFLAGVAFFIVVSIDWFASNPS